MDNAPEGTNQVLLLFMRNCTHEENRLIKRKRQPLVSCLLQVCSPTSRITNTMLSRKGKALRNSLKKRKVQRLNLWSKTMGSIETVFFYFQALQQNAGRRWDLS